MKELTYPFDGDGILKRSRRIRRELLADGTSRMQKKIAVLGGSTTHDIVRVLELFLLDCGIEPVFYESEYARYWQDAMFPEEPFASFAPDIVFLHTSNCNITEWPVMADSEEAVLAKEEAAFSRFRAMWEKLKADHNCTIIQNNFEYPSWRLLGNRDAWDLHGRVRFVDELNRRFAAYARAHDGFYINDIHYLSARYGLDAWSEPSYWYMYKYALAVPAIPSLAFNVANIIKSVYGKNKKALVLDMDNTLWGGVIGDDGVEKIAIGKETAEAEAFTAFQEYVKAQKDIGIVLNVASKNDAENALAGLRHPDSVLTVEDFVFIRANWEPKSGNVEAIAAGLNLLPESLVFVDDNPAEREIVTAQVPGVVAPEISLPEHYIRVIDHSGFFEATTVSGDDAKRAEMYRENAKRLQAEAQFADYTDYLKSLDMHAEIAPFTPLLYERIAQLTNKSNQFNLTTKRFTVDEIGSTAADENRITLYGRLRDRFGDNGVVSLLIARIDSAADGDGIFSADGGGTSPADGGGTSSADAQGTATVELWLMSCRVLKRDMEFAMMDALVEACRSRGIRTINGFYFPTAKNKMVEDFYALQGFTRADKETEARMLAREAVHSPQGAAQTADGRTASAWVFTIEDDYQNKNTVIDAEGGTHDT